MVGDSEVSLSFPGTPLGDGYVWVGILPGGQEVLGT
jgi:hypothetical protein